MRSTFITQPGCLTADQQKKKKKKKKEEEEEEEEEERKRFEFLCKKMASFSLLKRYVFYYIHMEVKENAQEQNIMGG